MAPRVYTEITPPPTCSSDQPVVDSTTEHRNPYRSPAAAADSRSKLGWLAMLVVLWPIVMAAVGSIIGFFVGRMSPEGIDPQVWNPGTGALAGAGVFALFGLVIGIRKASGLRHRLDTIHARREELRLEVERLERERLGRTGTADRESENQSGGGLTSDGRAP
jgi:hypothetical protein